MKLRHYKRYRTTTLREIFCYAQNDREKAKCPLTMIDDRGILRDYPLFSSPRSKTKAACLSKGSLLLPHLGDWMQLGQPS